MTFTSLLHGWLNCFPLKLFNLWESTSQFRDMPREISNLTIVRAVYTFLSEKALDYYFYSAPASRFLFMLLRLRLIHHVHVPYGLSLWQRKWQPTPVFLPGESHGPRRLAGYSPWGHRRVRHGLVTNQPTKAGFVVTCVYNQGFICLMIFKCIYSADLPPHKFWFLISTDCSVSVVWKDLSD